MMIPTDDGEGEGGARVPGQTSFFSRVFFRVLPVLAVRLQHDLVVTGAWAVATEAEEKARAENAGQERHAVAQILKLLDSIKPDERTLFRALARRALLGLREDERREVIEELRATLAEPGRDGCA